MSEDSDVMLFCHRCGQTLKPGQGNWYVVRIEAFAEPAPPNIDPDGQDELDINAEFTSLMEEMRHMGEQELLDQVHRRVTIHLCGNCYRDWIENPAG